MNPGHYVKGDPRAIARGKIGGAISAARKQAESIANWLIRFPGTSPEAAREIYRAGFNAGSQSKYQSQKRSRRPVSQQGEKTRRLRVLETRESIGPLTIAATTEAKCE